MFTRKDPPKYQKLLESEIERMIREMPLDEPGGYGARLGYVERLQAMLIINTDKPSRVSPETKASVAANLLGIIMIIKHESVNVITSKAMSFVMKIR